MIPSTTEEQQQQRQHQQFSHELSPCKQRQFADFSVQDYSRWNFRFPALFSAGSPGKAAYLVDNNSLLSYCLSHKTCLSRVVEGKALRNHSNRPSWRQVLIPAERQR
jgi:hypothetical protein